MKAGFTLKLVAESLYYQLKNFKTRMLKDGGLHCSSFSHVSITLLIDSDNSTLLCNFGQLILYSI